jgi:hypothetical protein
MGLLEAVVQYNIAMNVPFVTSSYRIVLPIPAPTIEMALE